jgi:hypothetical protein
LTTTYAARSGNLADAGLLDWLRHYGLILLLVTALGAAGAGAAWWFATPRYELWTIVADTGSQLPDRQVGVVAQTFFQDQHTYADALASTVLTSLDPAPSATELLDTVQLRSVPDSRLMIVVARGDDATRTAAISVSMAQALSDAFVNAKYTPLSILGNPQPAPVESAGSLGLFAILGATGALLLALGATIAHYRTRRPVLEFGAMMTLLSPSAVVAVSARRGWLGALRHIAPVGLSRTARDQAAQRLRTTGGVGSIRWPGASERRLRRLTKLAGVGLDPDATVTVIVSEPCSRSRDLAEIASIDPVGRTTVLWLA